jgi:hypothetical protein
MLCELLTLKTRLKIAEADVVDDAVLEGFIAAVSGRFDKETNRTLAYSAAATYDFRGDEMNLVVDRYPIVSVTSFSLKTTETDGFVAQTGIDYLVNGTRSIVELGASLGTSREIGRVTFAGGYVMPGTTPSGSQTALPDELEQACVEQAAWYYRNKDTLGLAGVSGAGGNISKLATADLLPDVQAVLKKYERWRN